MLASITKMLLGIEDLSPSEALNNYGRPKLLASSGRMRCGRSSFLAEMRTYFMIDYGVRDKVYWVYVQVLVRWPAT